jgi:hypothetical protein
VWVGVIDAVLEDHVEIDTRPPPGKLLQVMAGGEQPGPVSNRHAFQTLHRQHAWRRELAKRPRDAEIRVVLEESVELLEVLLFAAEIELAAHRPLELGDDCPRPIGGQLGELLGELREAGEDLDIDADLGVDIGVLHLDHHPLAVGKPGAMDLTDRGGGDRHVVEFGEELLDRPAEFLLDGVADLIWWVGRHIILKLLQFLGQRRSDDVGPRAEDLPQLDEGRPKIGKGQADAGFACEPGEMLALPAREDALGELEIEVADPIREPITAEDGENLRPAVRIAIELRDGAELHEAELMQERRIPQHSS